MPVRSLNSSVLRWPDRTAVDTAVRGWAAEAVASHPETLRVGYFGSYATGQWGVGSDVDLVVVVRISELPFEMRGTAWDTTVLPVPADVVVYTEEEWERFEAGSRFREALERETVWVLERPANGRSKTDD